MKDDPKLDGARRSWLTGAALSIAGAALPALPGCALPPSMPSSDNARRELAYERRRDAAERARAAFASGQATNGDEARYPDRIGSFTKGLAHDRVGRLVDVGAYDGLRAALQAQDLGRLGAVPIAGTGRFVGLTAPFAFGLSARDTQGYVIPAPPALASEAAGLEMAALYWFSQLRDVPFVDYDGNALARGAADFLARAQGRPVAPGGLMRGATAGDRVGPVVSQFLLAPVPVGPYTAPQKIMTPAADYCTDYDAWLAVQNGKGGAPALSGEAHYVRNGRDLAEVLRRLFQPAQGALAQLQVRGVPPNPVLPRPPRNDVGFNYGLTTATELAMRATFVAVQASFAQKWLAHRRLRPEEYGGLVHNHLAGAARAPVHDVVLEAVALARVRERQGSWLLSQVHADGSPMHPSYPGNHAATTGAAVTILKAFYSEAHPWPDPVEASADGSALVPYRGAPITVGGELDKLASNMAIGREMAGIHYRSDTIAGLRLGEAVAIALLGEARALYPERLDAFRFTSFDGEPIVA